MVGFQQGAEAHQEYVERVVEHVLRLLNLGMNADVLLILGRVNKETGVAKAPRIRIRERRGREEVSYEG